ncbi:MAG: FkbM family methyltransferase [Verrucomicrobiae bacterium]|nr:FkbM family methyltransferase [Verrucomicrobiae bacterium]
MQGRISAWARGMRQGLGGLVSGNPGARAYARRLLAWRTRGLFQSEATFRRNGFVWTGPTTCSITETIFTTDHYQDARLEELVGWLRTQPVFDRPVIVNVGANLGDLVLPLSRIGKRIIAVEPNPETFARLVRNVRQNGLEAGITCCEVAIAARPGTARLAAADDPGNSELEDEAHRRLGFEGQDRVHAVYDVKTSTLDGLLASVGVPPHDVALVISDTQGFESQVVASGTALWQCGVPLWVELWPKGLACHGGVEAFLDLCGHQFRSVVPETGIGRPPEPVQHLRTLVERLRDAEFTDALLIP